MTPDRWQRIEELYHAAYARPAGERAAFLDQACRGDSTLRREVESLLSEPSRDEFLDVPSQQAATHVAAPSPPDLIGHSLGGYRLEALLGEGGMGEVYRSRDEKLGRDVAIKILPRAFTSHPDRLARFEREARMLAALNQPNICAIYGFEQADGVRFLILELVTGDTLAHHLAQASIGSAKGGGLPLARALTIARQITDALEAAHDKGIIHRDLKPANIKITPDGVVKVLDFGLAKAVSGDGSAPDLTHAPDATSAEPRPGAVIGTPAYMSPEQARGLPVDKRTDIWAFGCVLYQMLTGRVAFGGDTASDSIAKILERDPDWSALPVTTPPAVRRLLFRCFAKDPKKRLRDIGDVRIELEDADAGGDEPVVVTQAPWFRRWWPAAVAGLMIGVAASFAYWWLQPTSARPNVRFERVTDAVGLEESPAISPDGKTVAYVAYTGRRRQIWIRRLDGGASRVTNADLDHEQPRWAPDSTTLLYFTRSATTDEPHGNLWEVSMLGGQPRPIVAALGGGDISHDGLRIATVQLIDDVPTLVVLRRDGSRLAKVAKLKSTGGRTPRWSPDDQTIAYTELLDGAFSNTLIVVPAAGGKPVELDRGYKFKGLSWIPDGSGLVYGSAQGSTVPYPPTFQLRLKRLDGGDSEQLTFGDQAFTDPDVHETGLVLATGTTIRSALWRVPTTGTAAMNTGGAIPLTRQTSQVQTPSASPDGKRIVYLSDSGGHGNLWITDADGQKHVQITVERNPSVSVGVPVWSTDGTQIVFLKGAPLNEQWLVKPDGSQPTKLLDGGYSTEWSHDGKWLYYATGIRDRPCIEKRLVADPAAPPVPVRCDSASAPMPHWDGATLFFQTRHPAPNGGFDFELRKARPEGAESTLLLPIDGRRLPYDSVLAASTVLSPDGKWVAYALMDGATANLWKVSTDGGDPVRITDFGDRALWIVRQVTWAGPDGRFIYAPIADVDADIVSIVGVVSGRKK